MNADAVVGESRGDAAETANCTPLYATPPGMAAPFRVLLLLPERIPAWISTFLDQATANAWMEVCVLPVAGAKLPEVTNVPLDLRAFLSMERKRRSPATSLETVGIDAHDRLQIAPGVRANVDGHQLRIRIRQLAPDLVLSLGPPSWADDLADLARWGCWNIDAGLVDSVSAGTALLAPVLKRQSATGVELELQLHKSWHEPASLASSWGSTHYGSFTRQRERAFLKLPMLLMRTLRRLVAEELDVPRHHAGVMRLKPPSLPLHMGAGVRALGTSLYRIALWQLQKRGRALSWMLVLRQDREPLDPAAPEVHSTAVIQAGPGHYWADPCAVDMGGRKLVFVEEMNPSGKGTIACLELLSGEVERLGLAIREPGHLSFPQVFQRDEEWYLTLESSSLKRVSLYRATSFPLGWTRIADLVVGRVCVDPVLHFHEGHWYLFATVAENRNSTWDELFVFVSDELTGPYRPHPANPVLSDVRRARPAGRLFEHHGKLIRPSQDCASGYGSAVVFNEVLELSPDQYRERAISRLAPDWSSTLVACHTYSAAGGVELLDARGLAGGSRRLPVREAAPAAVAPQVSARTAAQLPTPMSMPPEGAVQ